MEQGTIARHGVQPMKTAGTQHLIERTYREGGTFQWVRETLRNAIEADATRIEFTVEWQAVREHGVYRRVIADNGTGMSATDLVTFFNTFGGGGKPIGGVHENFGVGAKTSLLPWNRHGLVVISWIDGEASMIRMELNPDTGEYGLRIDEVEDEDGNLSLETVYEPGWDDELQVDWSTVKPDWIEDHGTIVVLLGNNSDEDTVLGDRNREEADIKGISSYLNRRWWELHHLEVWVEEFHSADRSTWPTRPVYSGQKRMHRRRIQGARHFIEYDEPGFTSGKLAASDTVVLPDGAQVDYYLWEGERPAVQSYASIGGFIGALYDGELYDVTSHHSSYRTFGISESAVRSKLWLIIRPPLFGNGNKVGVYPNSSRNALLVQGGIHAGDSLPMSDWGANFADRMPAPIRAALKAARAATGGGTLDDDAWRQRLIERFGKRWRLTRLRATPTGKETVEPSQAGDRPRRPRKKMVKQGRRGGGNGGLTGQPNISNRPGSHPASKRTVAGGIPRYLFTTSENINPGILAFWQPNHPEHPEGVVFVVADHSVLEDQIVYWQSQYADHHAEAIREAVLQAYGEIAVSKVAHSEHLRGVLPSAVIDEQLRSDTALTMSLLGLMAEEAVIAPRMGQFGRRHTA